MAVFRIPCNSYYDEEGGGSHVVWASLRPYLEKQGTRKPRTSIADEKRYDDRIRFGTNGAVLRLI